MFATVATLALNALIPPPGTKRDPENYAQSLADSQIIIGKCRAMSLKMAFFHPVGKSHRYFVWVVAGHRRDRRGLYSMIWKAGATMGAFLPVAAAAIASDHGAVVTAAGPAIWYFVGYPFEAGSMIAAICACLAVRFYVVQTGREQHRWTVDLPVTVLVVMFSAAGVIRMRPDPALALMIGTGLGALGAGIISIALGWVRKTLPGGEDKPAA